MICVCVILWFVFIVRSMLNNSALLRFRRPHPNWYQWWNRYTLKLTEHLAKRISNFYLSYIIWTYTSGELLTIILSSLLNMTWCHLTLTRTLRNRISKSYQPTKASSPSSHPTSAPTISQKESGGGSWLDRLFVFVECLVGFKDDCSSSESGDKSTQSSQLFTL